MFPWSFHITPEVWEIRSLKCLVWTRENGGFWKQWRRHPHLLSDQVFIDQDHWFVTLISCDPFPEKKTNIINLESYLWAQHGSPITSIPDLVVLTNVTAAYMSSRKDITI